MKGTKKMTIRINVVDSDVRRRARISHALHARGAYVEIFESVAELREHGKVEGLLFIADEPAGGLAAKIAEVRATTPAVLPIVGYAEDPDAEPIVAAMRAGAVDYLRWPFAERVLDRVFARLAEGDDRLLQEAMVRSQARARVAELSGRETDVLTQLVRGLTNKEIGRALCISHRTVEIHRANMMAKLGASSSGAAVRIGVHAGLDTAEPATELLAA
jgi:FixJ family two-component response regulator